jgi:hypothetical protein
MTRLMSLKVLIAVAGCSVVLACEKKSEPKASRADVSELWIDPGDLERRDLFYGPGGKAFEPDSNGRFRLLKHKEKGTNLGYDVVDERGREWSVKLGKESRAEVTMSRVLWAVGYHQPSIYHVRRWTLTDDGKESAEPQSRFRLEGDALKREEDWAWADNPFRGTREFAGLQALMVIFNNWDLKTVQNVIYDFGMDSTPRRRYVVKDLGSALGQSGWPLHTKDDADGFDSEPFITGVRDSLVRFAFRNNWPDSLRQDIIVKPADLRWICSLLQRLSDKQWRDAFRAGGFRDEEAERYIRRLQRKIADGLALH